MNDIHTYMHETKKELIRKRRAKRFTDNVFDASLAVLLCKSDAKLKVN